MADIEDLIKDKNVTNDPTRLEKLSAIRKNFSLNRNKNKPFDPQSLEDQVENIGLVPGAQKIYVKTFGCSHNISDSEFMMGQLVEYGYELTEDPFLSDLILINSCTVKNPSQAALMRMVFDSKDIKKPVVVAGCVTQGDHSIDGLQDVSIVGITQIDRVVEVVEETLKGHTVQLLAKKSLPQLDLPKIRKNKFIEILAVNTGCLGNCTYCKTKHARGHLGSYHPDEIIRRALKASEEGAREIWLTSEDTGAYGRDIGTDIAQLLISLAEKLPAHMMLRVGMTNPPYILEHLAAVAKVLAHPRVFGFLHVPVQSGSDTVLERMNREYTCGEFSQVVDTLREKVGKLSLATDIICGFPGETEAEHKDTINLLQKYNFEFVNISQFYPRPGTIAARMKQINSKVKKDRSREVTEVFNSSRSTQKHFGSIERVWIAEKETVKGEDVLVGHMKDYTKVVLPFEEALLGTCILVKITVCKKWHVEGEIIDRSPEPLTVPEDYFAEFKTTKEEINEAEFLEKIKTIDQKTTAPSQEVTAEIEPAKEAADVADFSEDENKHALLFAICVFLLALGLLLKIRGY